LTGAIAFDATDGGTLAPGEGLAYAGETHTIGTLTVKGNVTLNNKTTFFVNLQPGAAPPPTVNDELVVSSGGTVDLNGATLAGTSGPSAATASSFKIIDAAPAPNGSVGATKFGNAAQFVTIGGSTYTVLYTTGASGNVILMPGLNFTFLGNN